MDNIIIPFNLSIVKQNDIEQHETAGKKSNKPCTHL